MDPKQLSLCLKEIISQGQSVSFKVADSETDLSLDHPIRLALSKFPDGSLPIFLYEGEEKLCRASYSLERILSEGRAFDDWISFPLTPNITEAIQIRLTGKISSMSLENPAPYKCKYLSDIEKIQFFVNSTENHLNSLSEDMGSMFQKIIYESVKLRSPSKSPEKKRVAKSKTPKQSPYAPSNGLIPQEKVIKVPCSKDLRLENLSGHDFDSLVECLIGLVAKKKLDRTAKGLVDGLNKAEALSEEAITLTLQSIQDTQAQTTQHFERFNTYFHLLKDEPIEEPDIEKRIKMNLEMREGLDLVLKKLKSKTCDSDEPQQYLEETLKLEKTYTDVFEEKEALITHFQKELSDFQETLRKIQSETHLEVTNKDEMQKELKEESLKTEKILREIRSLKTSIKLNSGTVYVQKQRNNKLNNLQNGFDVEKLAREKMETDYNSTKNAHKSVSIASEKVVQRLETNCKDLSNQEHLSESKSQDQSNVQESITKLLTSLEITVKELPSAFSSLDNASSRFCKAEKRLDLFMRNLKLNELDFLSDLSFRWSGSSMFAHRVHKQLKEIKAQREHDKLVMLQATNDLKKQNPVYRGDKTDSIDKALADSLNGSDRTLLVPFLRQDTGVYVFGSKRVLVKLERNKLQVKVGGGFLPIEDFLEAYQPIEKEKMEQACKEYSESARKFMGKWAEGIIDSREQSPERMRKSLVDAQFAHGKAPTIAIKQRTPIKRSRTAFAKKSKIN